MCLRMPQEVAHHQQQRQIFLHCCQLWPGKCPEQSLVLVLSHGHLAVDQQGRRHVPYNDPGTQQVHGVPTLRQIHCSHFSAIRRPLPSRAIRSSRQAHRDPAAIREMPPISSRVARRPARHGSTCGCRPARVPTCQVCCQRCLTYSRRRRPQWMQTPASRPAWDAMRKRKAPRKGAMAAAKAEMQLRRRKKPKKAVLRTTSKPLLRVWFQSFAVQTPAPWNRASSNYLFTPASSLGRNRLGPWPTAVAPVHLWKFAPDRLRSWPASAGPSSRQHCSPCHFVPLPTASGRSPMSNWHRPACGDSSKQPRGKESGFAQPRSRCNA